MNLSANARLNRRSNNKSASTWCATTRAWRRWIAASVVSGVALGYCLAGNVSNLSAEEPFDRFLSRLKEEQLNEMALRYLDQQNQLGQLSPAIAQSIGLERALLLQQLALQQRSDKEREAKLAESEAAFTVFLDQNKEHPRRSEGRLALANLQLIRGEQILDQVSSGKLTEDKRPTARPFYDKAAQLFNQTLEELTPVLKELSGSRVDAKDEALVSRREQYREEYSQAQLLAAYSKQRSAECLPSTDPAYKTALEEAEKKFTEIYLNKTRADGVRNFALFYRAGIQVKLAKIPEAVDSYQRIAELDVPDGLRRLKTQAITELLKIWVDPAQNKYEPAVTMAKDWLKKMQGPESKQPAWIDFQLAAAQVYLAAMKKLQADKGSVSDINRLEDDARSTLQDIARLPGKHQEQARKLLAELGVKVAAPVEKKGNAKTFKEALDAAQSRLTRAETANLTLEIIGKQREQESDPEEKKKLEEQLKKTEDDLAKDQAEVSTMLQDAMRLFGPEDERSQLQQARYLLAYSFIKQKRFYESLVTAEFTSNSSPGEEIGIRAGNLALLSYQQLLVSADAERQKELTGQLALLAEYLLKTWPSAQESQQAANLLIQLSMINQQWDKAQEYLKMLPVDGNGGTKVRRQLGLLLWDQYVRQLAASGVPTPSPELVTLREKATQILQEGLGNLKVEEIDATALEASVALIRATIQAGKMDEAAAMLEKADVGPLSIMEKHPEIVTQKTTGLNVYRTALQVVVARLGNQADPSQEIERVKTLISQLRTQGGEDEEGKKLVAAIFVGLARDLQQQLESSPSLETRKKLAVGIGVVLGQVREGTKDVGTLQWVGQTLTGIGKAIRGDGPTPTAESSQLVAEAVSTFNLLLDQPEVSGSPDAVVGVKFRMAQALLAQGKYEQSVEMYGEILKAKSALLDVQVEAARTLQEWAKSGASQQWSKAIGGDLPDGKSRQNAIWGWGKISSLTSGKPNLADTFFEARYQLAYCRLQSARVQKDAETRKKIIEKARDEISQAYKLFPALGGDTSKARFDTILREIQKELKEPVVGLQAFVNKPK